jgi:hypothetical protein
VGQPVATSMGGRGRAGFSTGGGLEETGPALFERCDGFAALPIAVTMRSISVLKVSWSSRAALRRASRFSLSGNSSCDGIAVSSTSTGITGVCCDRALLQSLGSPSPRGSRFDDGRAGLRWKATGDR